MLSHISWIVASIAGHRCERIAAYGASDNVEAVKAGGGRPSNGRLYGGSVFGSRCACTCGGTQQMAHPIAMPGIEEELLCSIFPSNVARWTSVSLGLLEYLCYFGPAEVSAVLCSSGSCCAL